MDKNCSLGLVNNKKHILILTPGFSENEDDFNCIPPLQEFLISFRFHFPAIKITVMSLHYPYHNKKYFWNNIPVFPLAGRNNTIAKLFLWLKGIRIGRIINSKEKIDLIHSLWLGECALLGTILSKKFNCPHVCTLMGQDVRRSNKYLRFLINKKIKIVALSKNQSDQFFKLTNKKVDETIHWGVDDQQGSDFIREIDLLAVGSLIPLKNYSLLVKTVESCEKINKDIKCFLVGTGPEEKNLKLSVEKKGLENNIEFAGLLSRTEIFKLMQRSKIFIHPSKFEGSGFVFAEALANGLNIVSFNVGYAQSNPKWFIAKNEEDFIDITKKLLTTELDFTFTNLFPLKETVNRYASLYGIERNDITGYA